MSIDNFQIVYERQVTTVMLPLSAMTESQVTIYRSKLAKVEYSVTDTIKL